VLAADDRNIHEMTLSECADVMAFERDRCCLDQSRVAVPSDLGRLDFVIDESMAGHQSAGYPGQVAKQALEWLVPHPESIGHIAEFDRC
jgi:hypothetical protein